MVIHELYLSTDGGNSQVKQEGYLKKRPRTDVRRANDTWARVGSRTRALGGFHDVVLSSGVYLKISSRFDIPLTSLPSTVH